MTPRAASTRARRPHLAAYAAFAWSVLFAALSFYWAAGGTAGVGMLAESIQEQARERDPGFIAIVWATGVLELAGAGLALALAQPWGRVVPRRLRVFLPLAVGVGLIVYGGSNFGRYVLMAAGVTDTPEAIGEDNLVWYLVLWEPVWLLGGVLFLLAGREHARASPRVPVDTARAD